MKRSRRWGSFDPSRCWSEFLRQVRAGEHLVVTDRGRPIAEITPISAERLSPEQRLGRLAAGGEVRLPRGRGLRPFAPMAVRGHPVSRSLLEDRG